MYLVVYIPNFKCTYIHCSYFCRNNSRGKHCRQKKINSITHSPGIPVIADSGLRTFHKLVFTTPCREPSGPDPSPVGGIKFRTPCTPPPPTPTPPPPSSLSDQAALVSVCLGWTSHGPDRAVTTTQVTTPIKYIRHFVDFQTYY